MTRAATALTTATDSRLAGTELGQHLAAGLQGHEPDVVVVFAAPQYDHAQLLRCLSEACHPALLVGCSSAGEFRASELHENGASALALSAPDMAFHVSCGTGVAHQRDQVAAQLVASFAGLHDHTYQYRTAIVLVDALTGYVDDLIGQLALRTAGTYQFVGGGAGDNAQFQRTPVFIGTEVYTDAAVALEILSNKPVGIGASHGWVPASDPMRVTESTGLRVTSLNATPAVEAFAEHADCLGLAFDRTAPLPFFLHHILGIRTPGGFQLRVPLAVEPDGSVLFAADVPAGSIVYLMRSSAGQAAEAARTAAEQAYAQLGGHPSEIALFFDCVATRLRLGEQFGDELQLMQQSLGATLAIGCNTHGQIVRAEGQFSGFHNCTAVVCAIPQ